MATATGTMLLTGGDGMPRNVPRPQQYARPSVVTAQACAAPVLMALLFYRAVTGPALPPALRPTWFILLVPPSLIYANGVALYPDAVFLELLYPFALVLAAALLVYARRLAQWPFGAPWWAFTFPLDALAYAAVRYAQEHPSALWKSIAGIAFALATLVVTVVLVRTVIRR